MLKLGVLGLNRGCKYVGRINLVHDAEITAICDINKEKADRIAKEHNISQVFYDYRDLLASDIDAVVVATPITLHAEHVIAALGSGKHVLSEVITATTVEDCKAVYDAVKKSSKKYMMAENYCYIRPLDVVRRIAADGKFGDIYYAESVYLKDFAEYRPDFPNIGGWRQPTYFGRKGHPYITHSIGPLLNIMKEKIVSVRALGAGNMYDMIADNTCALLCKTEKGNLVSLRSSFVSPRPDNFIYYALQGNDGCYQGPVGDTDFHKINIRGVTEKNEWRNVYEFKNYYPEKFCGDAVPAANELDCDSYKVFDSGFANMLQDFINCIINDTEPPINAEDSANWTLTGLMSGVSVENDGAEIAIPTLK